MSPLSKILQEFYKEVNFYEMKNMSGNFILGVVKFNDKSYQFKTKKELKEWSEKSGYKLTPYKNRPNNVTLDNCKKYPHLSEAKLGMPTFKPNQKYFYYNRLNPKHFKNSPLKYGMIYSVNIGRENPKLGLITLDFSIYKNSTDKSPSMKKSTAVKKKDLEKIIKFDLMNVSRNPSTDERTIIEWNEYDEKYCNKKKKENEN